MRNGSTFQRDKIRIKKIDFWAEKSQMQTIWGMTRETYYQNPSGEK